MFNAEDMFCRGKSIEHRHLKIQQGQVQRKVARQCDGINVRAKGLGIAFFLGFGSSSVLFSAVQFAPCCGGERLVFGSESVQCFLLDFF